MEWIEPILNDRIEIITDGVADSKFDKKGISLQRGTIHRITKLKKYPGPTSFSRSLRYLYYIWFDGIGHEDNGWCWSQEDVSQFIKIIINEDMVR